MNRRILPLIVIVLLALVVPTLLVACEETPVEKTDYSVTVLSPNDEPLANLTVNWRVGDTVAGTAQTDADGKATASLAYGTYNVTIEGFDQGLDYTPFSVTSAMRNVTVNLSVKRVNYAVTVIDKTGAPAAGVTVNWTSGNVIAGTATTNAQGKAAVELNYGQYTVTLDKLPEGNLYDGAKIVNGENPSIEFNLRNGTGKTYSVTVKSEGGLLFKNQLVLVNLKSDDTAIAAGKTDENGMYRFTVEAGEYKAFVEYLPEGYSYDEIELTPDVFEYEIVLHSQVIAKSPAANQTYVIGDIIHDYSFETPYEINGQKWSKTISEILKTKEVILINNWGTKCSYCVQEMPEMQQLYEKYSNRIEIIATSNYQGGDSDSVIRNYYASNDYTFPMMRDVNGFAAKFSLSGWPTTIVIDRYGAIARIEAGAILSYETWERLISKYIGDDYVQTFNPGDRVSQSINSEVAKPDVVVDADHYEQVANAINNTDSFPNGVSVVWNGETRNEYIWPFVLGTDETVSPTDKVLYASNTGRVNSWAVIYATVTVDAGKVFTFDYYADTEKDDILYVVWDGRIVREISGNSSGWQTCYLYTDLTSGEHQLAFSYIKDDSVNLGKDNVYLRNVRFVEISDIDAPTDMLRGAAYGPLTENATEFPYYAEVAIASDGFYHVNLSKLQNPEFAGNDESPLLLVNLLNATPWSTNASISELILATDEQSGEYVFSCEFTINGVKRDYRADLVKYLSVASASDVPDHVPVNKQLHDMLVAFMHNVSGDASHENEWLEACYFYSHYGSGRPISNPIVGLLPETAIEMTENETYTANLTRIMAPFATATYSFVPAKDGVYKLESFIPDKLSYKFSAQIWLFDDNSDAEKPLAYSGELRVTLDATNEQNFVVYHYMLAGHKYYVQLALQMNELGEYDFKVSYVGDSVTMLEPASHDLFDMVFDDEGNLTNQLALSGAIDYVLDEDGYYHAKNPDGSAGEFIYLDVLHANTSALGTIPLYRLVPKFVQDPSDKHPDLDYKFFDFRYCVVYIPYLDADGNELVDYTAKFDLSVYDSNKYKDYTAIMQAYVDSAPTEGELKGMIKVDKELADILKLFIELRANGVYYRSQENMIDIDYALENEWLRFCWYYKTYEADTNTENE